MGEGADEAYRVLEALARRPGHFLTRADLEGRFGSRVVREAAASVSRLGYPLEVHPVHGLRLREPADTVSADRLETRALGRRAVRMLDTASTNDLALSAAERGEPHGTLFLAEHQSRGRGRLGRSWHSPAGRGLWFSLVLRIDAPVQEGWRITLGAGAAVAEAVRATAGLRATVKWPNDVQVRRRKLAGILTETRTDGRRLAFAALGVGVNVNQEAEEIPEALRVRATSLRRETGRSFDRGSLLAEILGRLESIYEGPEDLIERWSALCDGWGEAVRVQTASGPREGVARRLAPDGALVIEREGCLEQVRTGEVRTLRPPECTAEGGEP